MVNRIGQAMVRRSRKYWNKCLWEIMRKWSPCRTNCGSGMNIDSGVRVQGTGEITLGENDQLGYWMANGQGCLILLQARNPSSKILIGSRTAIMNGCNIIACESISSGCNTAIGSEVLNIDSDSHGLAPGQRKHAHVIVTLNSFPLI